jgi:hypothetical protein
MQGKNNMYFSHRLWKLPIVSIQLRDDHRSPPVLLPSPGVLDIA